MRVFLAGFSAGLPDQGHKDIVSRIAGFNGKVRELLSYMDLVKENLWRKSMVTAPVRCELFLDSGAYSAWSRGVSISLEEYAQFILDRPGVFSVVANLDVIPGSWGVVPSQQEIDESAGKGWENYYALKKLLAPTGLVPMHIYHQGEDIKWLKKLMEESGYFGVSPGNDRTTVEKIQWLDEVFDYLCDDLGRPMFKAHGFGVTALEILYRFPWYSVDSTSWILTGRFGAVFVPLRDQVHKITFSNRSPKITETGEHFNNFSLAEQQVILKYIESKGFTPTELSEDYIKRDEINIEFFLDLEKNWVERPFKRNATQPKFSL